MKKARKKKPSKPRPLSIPAGGTDQEPRDALDKSIDPATARELRLKFDWQRGNDDFTARYKPPIVEWLKARQTFNFHDFCDLLETLGKLSCDDFDGVFHIYDDERHRFSVHTNFICVDPEDADEWVNYARVRQGRILRASDVP